MGPPPSLEQALADEIARAKQDEPLAPVAVLIGGTLLRPYLQRRLATAMDGIVNVHFITAAQFALTLGEHALQTEKRQPLPPLADRVLARQVARAHKGYFEEVRQTAGFSSALFQLIRELRGAGYDAAGFAEAIPGASDADGKDEALANLFTELEARRSGFYGPDDCMLAAADAPESPWTALAVYGLWDASPVLRRCLAELAKSIPVTLLLPETGTDADDATADLRAWATTQGAKTTALDTPADEANGLTHLRTQLFKRAKTPGPHDGSVRLLSGPDPTREIREVARTCLAWAREGIRFCDMAVVYRHPEPYRPVIESVFTEAGVPLYLHEGTPLIERPIGRRVSALLDLFERELERRSVMEFVTDAHFPKATREAYGGAPAARWDRVSREAGVVKGIEQWKQRLDRYREDKSEREWESAQKDADTADHLKAFVEDLYKDLKDHADTGLWSEHLTVLTRILTRYVNDPSEVLDAIDGLRRLDLVSGPISFDGFREVVRDALENLRSDQTIGGQPGAFGRRGVNVLDANSLRHLNFRAVAIVGVSERSFPPPPRPDPLLLDDERERLNTNEKSPGLIPLRVRGADTEPLQFALATAAARDRLIVSYARKSASDGRAQLPSSFYRAVAEAMRGEPVEAERVDDLPADLYLRASGSRIGARQLDEALSVAEHDRTLIETKPELGRAALIAGEPRMKRAFAAHAARLTTRLTPFDGVLSEAVLPHLAEVRDPDRAYSASGLKNYADCPHKYLLGNVLKLNAIQEPEEITSIDPRDKGSLVHKILERFLREPPADGELLHGEGEQDRLLEIAAEESKAIQEHGATGYRLIWDYLREEINEDLRRWLEAERAEDAFRALPHGEYEVWFGESWRKDEVEAESEADERERDELSLDDPIEITADGTRLRVHGFIDRLNWNEDRSAYRVVDYKIGGTFGMPDDGALKGGRALQLPLYLLAGAALLDTDATNGSAEYHYPTRKGGFSRAKFDSDDLAERTADLHVLLSGIVEGARSGVFQREPEEPRACVYCDFNKVCPTERFVQMRRKAGDERAKAFAELRVIE